jgi:hypothetical protein
MKKLYSEEQRGVWDIKLYFEADESSPYDIYDSNDDVGASDIKAIEDGEVTWLVANVTASIAGVEVAETYLGAIVYYPDKLDEFLIDGYYEDMVTEVIIEGRKKLDEIECKLKSNT